MMTAPVQRDHLGPMALQGKTAILDLPVQMGCMASVARMDLLVLKEARVCRAPQGLPVKMAKWVKRESTAPQAKKGILEHLGCLGSLDLLELKERLEIRVKQGQPAKWDHQVLQVQTAKKEHQVLRDCLEHLAPEVQMAFLVQLASKDWQVARVLLDLLEFRVQRALKVRKDTRVLLGLQELQVMMAGMAKSVHLDL